MSYGGYQQYGGNPYESSAPGGYGQSNPYGQSGDNNGGAQPTSTLQQPPPLQHETSNYSQAQSSQYSVPVTQANTQQGQQPYPLPNQPKEPMPVQDFLERVRGTQGRIRELTSNIGQIANIHQRLISDTNSSASAQLENIVTNTQVLNTGIKDEIKFLEADAARSGSNPTKDSQIRNLKKTFEEQLRSYQEEERTYERRYRDQIARQYRIVNPEATDEEVNEAANANWGDEGVFQTALKSNRSGQASSVLGAVRARHNDIQQIEKTLTELNQLFRDLAEAVLVQDEQVQQVEQQADTVKQDVEHGNVHLGKGIESARRARKLKWIMFFVVLAIIVILALVLGLYFGVKK